MKNRYTARQYDSLKHQATAAETWRRHDAGSLVRLVDACTTTQDPRRQLTCYRQATKCTKTRLISHSESIELDQAHKINILDLDTLIATKIQTARDKDLVMLEILYPLQNLEDQVDSQGSSWR